MALTNQAKNNGTLTNTGKNGGPYLLLETGRRMLQEILKGIRLETHVIGSGISNQTKHTGSVTNQALHNG